MPPTAERSVSGRSLVIIALAFTAIILAVGVLFGPQLRQAVLQEQRPRTLREPIAAGVHDGQPWEAIGHFDGTKNCVELRYLGEALGRACDDDAHVQVTTLPQDGPTVAYGVADEEWTRVTVVLDDGEAVAAAAKAGELGFPVSFWATEIPPGTTVDEVRRGD
jgi:hypothetical protein